MRLLDLGAEETPHSRNGKDSSSLTVSGEGNREDLFPLVRKGPFFDSVNSDFRESVLGKTQGEEKDKEIDRLCSFKGGGEINGILFWKLPNHDLLFLVNCFFPGLLHTSLGVRKTYFRNRGVCPSPEHSVLKFFRPSLWSLSSGVSPMASRGELERKREADKGKGREVNSGEMLISAVGGSSSAALPQAPAGKGDRG